MKPTTTIKSIKLMRKITINKVKARIGELYMDVDLTYICGKHFDLGRLEITTCIVPTAWGVVVESHNPEDTFAFIRNVAAFPAISDIWIGGTSEALNLEIRHSICATPSSTDETFICIKLLRCTLSDSWDKNINNY
jgi:hypothetical protein